MPEASQWTCKGTHVTNKVIAGHFSEDCNVQKIQFLIYLCERESEATSKRTGGIFADDKSNKIQNSSRHNGRPCYLDPIEGISQLVTYLPPIPFYGMIISGSY